jgi:hypothetical protein
VRLASGAGTTGTRRVRRTDRALAGERDARRTVEQREVVAIAERFEEAGEASRRVVGAVEVEVEMAQREVCGHDVDRWQSRPADVGRQLAVSAH